MRGFTESAYVYLTVSLPVLRRHRADRAAGEIGPRENLVRPYLLIGEQIRWNKLRSQAFVNRVPRALREIPMTILVAQPFRDRGFPREERTARSSLADDHDTPSREDAFESKTPRGEKGYAWEPVFAWEYTRQRPSHALRGNAQGEH